MYYHTQTSKSADSTWNKLINCM